MIDKLIKSKCVDFSFVDFYSIVNKNWLYNVEEKLFSICKYIYICKNYMNFRLCLGCFFKKEKWSIIKNFNL